MQVAGVSDPERFWSVALGSPQAVVPALGKPDLSHEYGDRRRFSAWWGDQRELLSVADGEGAFAIVMGRPRASVIAIRPVSSCSRRMPPRAHG